MYLTSRNKKEMEYKVKNDIFQNIYLASEVQKLEQDELRNNNSNKSQRNIYTEVFSKYYLEV